MVHGVGFGEETGARKIVFFHVMWLQPAGTLCVRRVRTIRCDVCVVDSVFFVLFESQVANHIVVAA